MKTLVSLTLAASALIFTACGDKAASDDSASAPEAAASSGSMPLIITNNKFSLF